ncbi:unnamed protein product [Moneuplotes crassus]|uniref:Uncharacterized protein n=1 Tax=Euplotes crassus TaxID=5936 RepID=A0AAD1Y7K9_EUPCR|nr:unnamed protein product [Moneuplotes crassus]
MKPQSKAACFVNFYSTVQVGRYIDISPRLDGKFCMNFIGIILRRLNHKKLQDQESLFISKKRVD